MKQSINYIRKGLSVFSLVMGLLLCTIVSAPLSAQEKSGLQISGMILDSYGSPAIGATITVVGKEHIGTSTNAQGEFKLSVPAGSSISVDYIGCQPQRLEVGNRTRFEIKLVEDVTVISDIVVVAYGVQNKLTVTGAISSIGGDDLLKSPTANLGVAMTGKLAGLSTVQRSGTPGGDTPTMYIRGNSNPLIIVDGVERSSGGSQASTSDGAITGFEQMDANDVESITVLKDASATAVYGVRGANGVVIITTKQGEKGAAKIKYSSNFSMSTPVKLPRTTSSYEWFSYMNEANANDGLEPRLDAETLELYRTNADPLLYPSMDYNSYMFNKWSWRQQHNVNISGGQRVRYFVSGGYTHDDGMLKQHTGYGFDPNWVFTRYNFRSNLNFDLSKRLSVGINLESRYEERQGCSTDNESTFFWHMYRALPYLSAGFVDDKYVVSPEASNSEPASIMERIMNTGNYYTNQTTVNSIFNVKYNMDFITKGLSANAKVSYDTWNYERYTRKRSYETYKATRVGDDNDGDGIEDSYHVSLIKANDDVAGVFSIANRANAKRRNFYLEGSLNYARTFAKDHEVTAMALYNQSKQYYSAGEPYDIPRAYLGFVGRATYNYRKRYMAEFNIGINGSENFPVENRYGVFPAFSLGWVISEEEFMKGQDVVSYLKLRASYGQVGNDKGIGRFLYLPSSWQEVATKYFRQLSFGDANTSWNAQGGMIEGNASNQNVTWEVSTKRDIALEGKMFNDRLNFVFDVFDEHRSGILTTMQNIPTFMIPAHSKIDLSLSAPVNYNKRSSYGCEVELGWHDKIASDTRYGFNATMAYAKVTNDLLSETYQLYPWLYAQGRSTAPMGYICEGFYESYDEINDPSRPYSTHGNDLVPGDLKYKDINGDMRIDANDKVPIGYTNIPKMTFSLSGNLNYKGVFVEVLFTAATMCAYVPTDEARIASYGGSYNMFADIVSGRWTPETKDTATYPTLRTSTLQASSHNYQDSSFWVWDASYIRLKNVQVGYAIPSKYVNALGLESVSIFISGQNLFTWSPIDLYVDPETISNNNRGMLYPVMKTYNFGLNITF